MCTAKDHSPIAVNEPPCMLIDEFMIEPPLV